MRFLGSFDSVVLAAVAAELEPLVGARLQRAIQPAADEIVLHLRRPAGPAAVLCSIHPRWARAHLVPAVSGSGTVGPFARLLRSRLEHARLRAVRQMPFERILELAFETDTGVVELIAELMGRHSNLILVQDGVIAGALRA
ncbi:MAG TPA: NFACT family protein, partial [bacterium]|nr:NFACT family protein [bacterium]